MLFYIWGHSYEFDIDNTWDKFEELCKQVQKDTDNDGVIDLYAMTNFSSTLYPAAVYSNGGQFIGKDENGFYNDLESDATMEALNWALDMIDKYELTLPTDKTFTMVHGNITLHYSVYKDQKTVILETLTPEEILTEGHQKELTTYKGVMVSKSHKDLDMFKINLLNSMNKNGFFKLKNMPVWLFTILLITFMAIIVLVTAKIITK